MYSFVGDTVLDPFLGSGTTVKVALELGRNAIGYEINEKFLDIIKDKLGLDNSLLKFNHQVQILHRDFKVDFEEVDYIPRIKNAKPKIDPKKLNFKNDRLYKVVDILDERTIKLNTGLKVRLLGVDVIKKDEALKYLKNYVLRKEVFLKFDNGASVEEDCVEAYVYLKNKIFVNAYLIKSGIAKAEREKSYSYKNKFIGLEKV